MTKTKTVIVLPTYNERENVKILIPQLEDIFKKIKNHDLHILVVDDKSPDGTADEIKSFQKKYKNIHLIQGEKSGLGAAYIRGFEHAANVLKADVMMEMDADLQHPPEMVPDFMKAIDEGYDFVIGSRYIKGGGTPDWTFKRKLISRTGNFFSRVVAGLYKVNDCTTGFRALRVSIYKKINIADLQTKGYAFQSTVLYEFLQKGAIVKEIPLIFRERKHGQSKISSKDFKEFISNSLRLRWKSSKTFILFVIVGAICTLVNLGALFVLVDLLGLDKKILAPAIALEISIIASFILNDTFTFKHENKSRLPVRIGKFHIAALSGFVINLLLYNLFLRYLGLSAIIGKYDYLGAQLIAVLIVTFWNYFINSRWTWKKK
ncbi:MAG: glycosyltransferase family 2 protein [archaeon]